jgi:TDG/mug DNA glycosylase family protein
VLFCGINPGLYSAATGNHFARPGNRFWPALYASGFTPRLLHPSEKDVLLQKGYGLTNVVSRATASAGELEPQEFVAGRKRLAQKVRRHRPRTVAFLGLGAYRHAFARPKARLGPQPEPFEGSAVWVLPSPSGLNANHQLPELVQLFRKLRESLEPAESVDALLRAAIAGKRLVSFKLHDLPRIGEPHDYGVRNGVPTLFFWQTGGESRSGPPRGWRSASIDKVSGLRLLEERFGGSRPAPTGRHIQWDQLFATVSARK